MRTLNDGTPIPILYGILWYPDGSKLSFVTPQDFEALPDGGVVLVQLLYDKPYKGKWLQEVLRGREGDYYFEHAGDYHNGRARDIPREVPEERIKEGALVDDLDFVRMYNEACEGVRVAER